MDPLAQIFSQFLQQARIPYNAPVPQAAPQAAPQQSIAPPPFPDQTDRPNVLPGRGGAPSSQPLNDAAAGFMAWLDKTSEETTPASKKKASPAQGSRAAAEEQTYDYPTQPHVLRQPGPGSMPAMPQFNAGAGQPAAAAQPTPSMFDVYGAPMPERRPLDLGQMFFEGPLPERRPANLTPSGGEVPPMPERKSAPSAQAAAAPKSPPKTASKASNRGGAVSPSSSQSRPSTFTNAPDTGDAFPASAPLFDPITRKFLLQTGLNLMVPQWGGPMANIGMAVGEGAEAVGRAEQADESKKLTKKKLELEQARIDKMGTGRKRSSESSGSKRLKEKTPAQQFAASLSPEASMYFTQRIKDLNKIGEEDGETPESKYQSILSETQNVDRRARERRGQVRSDELTDKQIDAVAGNAALEAQVLQATSADPAQRAMVQTRIEQAKQRKATNGKPAATAAR